MKKKNKIKYKYTITLKVETSKRLPKITTDFFNGCILSSYDFDGKYTIKTKRLKK